MDELHYWLHSADRSVSSESHHLLFSDAQFSTARCDGGNIEKHRNEQRFLHSAATATITPRPKSDRKCTSARHRCYKDRDCVIGLLANLCNGRITNTVLDKSFTFQSLGVRRRFKHQTMLRFSALLLTVRTFTNGN